MRVRVWVSLPLRNLSVLLSVLALLALFEGERLVPSENQAPVRPPPVTRLRYIDIAAQAGFRAKTIIGEENVKRYILESTGGPVAVFDYNNDGWPDIFLGNGSRVGGFPPGEEPTNHLYRNNGDGTFKDVTREAGLNRSGWAQGVCVG